jgi:hypothetical protein
MKTYGQALADDFVGYLMVVSQVNPVLTGSEGRQ